MKIQTIYIRGAAVTINWSDRDHTRAGTASFACYASDLNEGPVQGPWDGEDFSVDGKQYYFGQHDYEDCDGIGTFIANFYEKPE